jgi:hypothetical protein
MTPAAIKLNVVPEPESDNELPETQSKRKASEMDFEIPPAKRTEPAEGSTTESESDSDVIPFSRIQHRHSFRPRVRVLSQSLITRQTMLTLARPRRSKSSLIDDSVTESESDDEHLGEAVRISRRPKKLHSRRDDFLAGS